MRIVFFGSGAFGAPTLRELHARHEVMAVVSQPDKPAGRSRHLTPTPIGELASELGIPTIHKPANVNEPAMVDAIRGLKADAWVVIAFGQKLGRTLLDGVFAINLHASLLPRWRGAAPINHAILAGDSLTGNSVITLADKMDAGLVLGQSKRPVESSITTGELHDLLAADGPALVLSVLADHAAGRVHGVKQDDSLVTIAPKLAKTDGWVELAEPAEMCRRRVNGLNPWPCVSVTFRGGGLKLLRTIARDADALPASAVPLLPGTIVDAKRGWVACGSGTILEVMDVQPDNARAMAWSAFANGHRVTAGEMLVGGRVC